MRKAFLALLLAASVGVALWVAFVALRTGNFSGQVFWTLLPFIMLAGIAWRGLTGKGD